MSQKRKRGLHIKPEGLTLITQKMQEKRYSHEKLAEVTGLSIDTVNAALRGERKDKDSISAIATSLDLQLTDLVEHSELYPALPVTADEINIDWRRVCGAMLKDQQEKQRLRRQATEMGFEVNVHVPLGLVKRDKQQRRGGDVEQDRVYELDRDAIAKTYQHDEFLQKAIANSQASENKNIAIIGEPGAGKTTYLQKIASFIQSDTQDFPICIPLASLQGRTLEDYLVKTWLPEALALVNPEMDNVETLYKTSLQKRFRQGGVWLLLDGVDEMGLDSPAQTLATIQQQLTDWVAQARIVLTCRLNVWDASINNALTNFDTYRTQQFQPEQINDFIQQWFTCAENIQRGEQLQAKLKESGRERIRELVKHPLRLVLLSQVFYRNEQAELPETKAGLYQLFTRYFYEWKQTIHPVDNSTQAELNQALGKLALAGIDSKARFRLKESLAREEMGERLFKLACDIGWLNLVDRDAKTDEAVYAFFHPTFQEYFAALAINDWHYFLNHLPYNPARGTYRIFEPQWKEVFLLWLGQENVSTPQKNECMQALTTFDSDENLYKFQALFIAGAGTAEFKGYSNAPQVIEQLVQLSFGYFNEEEKKWYRFQYYISTAAKKALLETQKYFGSNILWRFMETQASYFDEYKCMEMVEHLALLDSNNNGTISMLMYWLDNQRPDECGHCDSWYGAIDVIKRIGFVNSLIIDELVARLRESYNVWIKRLHDKDQIKVSSNRLISETLIPTPDERQWHDLNLNRKEEIADLIGELCPGNQEVTNFLIEIIRNYWNDCLGTRLCSNAALTLNKIDPGNLEVVSFFIEVLQTNNATDLQVWSAIKVLLNIAPRNLQVVKLLTDVLNSFLQKGATEFIRKEAAKALLEIDPGSSQAIQFFIEQLRSSRQPVIERINIINFKDFSITKYEDDAFRIEELEANEFADALWEVSRGNSTAIEGLVSLLTCSNEVAQYYAAWLLGEIGTDSADVIKALTHLRNETSCLGIRFWAVRSLWKIQPNDPEKILNLLEFMQPKQESVIERQIISDIKYMLDKNHKLGINILLEKLKSSVQSGEFFWFSNIAYVLKEVGTSNSKVINYLKELLENTPNLNMKIEAAEVLGKIDFGNINAISTLLHFSPEAITEKILPSSLLSAIVAGLQNCKPLESKEYGKILWHCAQNMSYPEFYQAWHGIDPNVEALKNQFRDLKSLLKQLQPTAEAYPIPVDANALEDETDKSAIAQALCNRIYQAVFPDNSENTPEVNNAFQLERSLFQLRNKLQKQHLALILYNCELNQTLISFCNKLTDVLHIAWVTNETLEPPLRGFLPDSSKLLSALRNWIDELG
ncbi:MAG: NACHT domain-containing protein [Aphanothece sp. CMT-3BRIN-NPC111]|jgi:HEAT repeat protein/transcriptional regulator with XRE-family HTH domain/muramidase (phage lysozyme)|nr:NACHT domain-containing protein [Aphanothece sp. CMT-3BRIN-NPC111]